MTDVPERPPRCGSTRILVYSAQMETIGGIESHVVEFCRQLAADGHHITLMSSRFALHPDAVQRLRRAGVRFVVNRGRWSSRSPFSKWVWTLLALFRLGNRRFDVVYTNGQGRNPATVQAWFRGRIRVVHHHHTSCDAGDIATWPRAYIDAMKRADALVVCAEFIRKRMQEAISRTDVAVVYCFSRDYERPKYLQESGGDRIVFGYFGRLIKEKGIDWILRLSADPRLSQIEWNIWGAEAAYRGRDFEPYTNVEYRGTFSTDEGLREAIDRLHCYCLFSSHPEGIPVSLIEIMAAGKPWIATAQGGIPELAHDPESCVVVSLDDYEGVVRNCLAMLERIRGSRIDGARQKAFYRDRFSKEALVPRWTGLLLPPGRVTPAR